METNNKLREALETARLFVTNCPTPLTTPLVGCGMSRAEVMNIIDAALAKPVKNFEVGTVEEQTDRWNNENPYPYEWDDTQYLDTKEVLKWAQMPYEEGGAE